MITIQPSKNEHQWPRNAVANVETRKRDLVIRITNWMDDRDEPAYDVECYIGGVYDWNESESFTMFEHKSKTVCKRKALEYAQAQIAKLL